MHFYHLFLLFYILKPQGVYATFCSLIRSYYLVLHSYFLTHFYSSFVLYSWASSSKNRKKKCHIENDLSKLKSQIPPKSRNRESPITGWAFLVFYFPIIDVAPHGACRPWIFFINGVLCFLKFNGSGMEKEERRLETPLQGEDESRRSSPP